MTLLSISHIPPGSPPWVTAAVVTGLVLHIGAGTVAVLSGAAALIVRKGERLHRKFGTIFFISMLVMAAMAIPLSAFIQQMNNVAGGILTFYLVGTAWMTVRRKDGTTGLSEKIALGVVLIVVALFLFWGLQASASPRGALYGYPAATFYIIAAFATFAAALDFRAIRLGGLSGTPRIARHLWRMCFALSGAAASFIGQQVRVLPALKPYGPALLLIAATPLVVMIFWLIRIRFTDRFKTAAQGN